MYTLVLLMLYVAHFYNIHALFEVWNNLTPKKRLIDLQMVLVVSQSLFSETRRKEGVWSILQ